MEMMTQGRFRHVPVVDDQERLQGIVSIGDVVKSRIEETVREAATLREYISAAG
jgi:CBS-domain-containing membrane protein